MNTGLTLFFCPTIYYIIMMFEEDYDIIAALKGQVV
jgi:hypothetical protein